MTTDESPKPARTRLWLRIMLVVSLAFNLLIIGAVAGIALKGGPLKHGPRGHHMADVAVGPLTRALTAEDRRAIGRQLREQAEDTGWSGQDHRASLEKMVVLLETTPFDPERFASEMETTIYGMQARLAAARVALAEHLAAMPDAERAAYAMRGKEVLDRMRQ